MTKKRIKILPSWDYFNKNFTEVSLAHWIMGDGYWDNTSKTVFLCTESFTEQEIEFLIHLLKKNLNLIATKRIRTGQGWRIKFSSKGDNLRSRVMPHMHPEMLYKLGI